MELFRKLIEDKLEEEYKINDDYQAGYYKTVSYQEHRDSCGELISESTVDQVRESLVIYQIVREDDRFTPRDVVVIGRKTQGESEPSIETKIQSPLPDNIKEKLKEAPEYIKHLLLDCGVI